MTTYIAWIEMDRARIFKVRKQGAEVRFMRRREIRHHTSRDPENRKNSDKFFKEVAEALGDAEEILLTGPSLAKEHFRTYLENHDRALWASIVGMLTLDLVTDAQIMAYSRSFFREYDVYGQLLPV